MIDHEGEAIKRFTLLVLLQAQEDRASELVINSAPKTTPQIQYKVHEKWYEMSPPPPHVVPGVLAELASLAGLQRPQFPAEGKINVSFSGTQLRWKIQLSNTDARCFPISPLGTMGQQPWS